MGDDLVLIQAEIRGTDAKSWASGRTRGTVEMAGLGGGMVALNPSDKGILPLTRGYGDLEVYIAARRALQGWNPGRVT